VAVEESGPSSLMLFARDPGSANQILALKDLLEDEIKQKQQSLNPPMATLLKRLTKNLSISQIKFAASGPALSQLRGEGLSPENWNCVNSPERARASLSRHQVRRLITGLSDRDDHTPQLLWAAASYYGANTLALLDDTTVTHPAAVSDLNERFRLPNGSMILPDTLGVINSGSRESLIKIGIPPSNIIVLGHLHLKRFKRLAATISPEKIAKLRHYWGVGPNANVILFASEPLSEMAEFGKSRDKNELSCLRELIRRVESRDPIVVEPSKNPTVIVVRPHPREYLEKFSGMKSDQLPRVIISREGTSAEAILAADSVFGITSMLLVEAASLGRRAQSLIDFNPNSAASPK
tara:strand:- start:4017 stop:5069 length:1053 start_codon:yes stop_codon:yes gene_type:complete